MNKSAIKIATVIVLMVLGFLSPSPVTAAEASGKGSIIDIVVDPLRCWTFFCEDNGKPGEPEVE